MTARELYDDFKTLDGSDDAISGWLDRFEALAEADGVTTQQAARVRAGVSNFHANRSQDASPGTCAKKWCLSVLVTQFGINDRA